jgi:ubiquinol-cytochrome c reductase iron-sulfur subunit
MTDTGQDAKSTRRDFVTIAAGSFVSVGGIAALWPLIDQMNPNPGTPPPRSVTVDLAPIEPGQTISVRRRDMPVFIRNRTLKEVTHARDAPLHDLRDRLARNDSLPPRTPATDANRTKAGHDNWFVVVGLCTHLGCLLRNVEPAERMATGDGWFCPCHAARFDLSGRVFAGPAATNLQVPRYEVLRENRLAIAG